ncbi:hypothetical protein [Bradyrhizobium sp. 170]|uniref:hypothetical protein n=1 Tax=Bradyrhizobium sp. 170 TaxID=2782641 RepID=UPI001FFF9A59|nr:hypothetical protein [Bradyrhizobium sp. 170]UPK07329.1 hypothetical protein IVB05_18525 [Bradyrhizobium sp. 170]
MDSGLALRAPRNDEKCTTAEARLQSHLFPNKAQAREVKKKARRVTAAGLD